jgi:hypothetical protein
MGDSLTAPILFGFALHCRRLRVLELEPVRPERYREPSRFDKIPSAPSLQAWKNTTCPSGWRSFKRTPGRLFRRMLARVALRTSIGSRRRSVPSSSSSSKANRNALASFRRWRSSWKIARPRSSHGHCADLRNGAAAVMCPQSTDTPLALIGPDHLSISAATNLAKYSGLRRSTGATSSPTALKRSRTNGKSRVALSA